MEIKKSQRLSQFLGVISDMVQYIDIGMDMVNFGTISANENDRLHKKLEKEGNINVMNELLTIINLRRGGFDAFLESLRRNDYEWIAEQLDPGKMLTESGNSTNGHHSNQPQGFLSGFRNIRSRKSVPVDENRRSSDDGLTFLTYRDSYPVDVSGQPFYDSHKEHKQDAYTKRKTSLPDIAPASSTSVNCATSTDMNLDFESLGLQNVGMETATEALVENVPTSVLPTKCEYFRNLATKLDLPPPAHLKVITSGKVRKTPCKRRKLSKIKLQFSSEDERDAFILSINQFVSNLKPNDDFYETAHQLHVSVPMKPNTFQSSKVFKKKPKNEAMETGVVKPKKHWYQHRFSLKSWKK